MGHPLAVCLSPGVRAFGCQKRESLPLLHLHVCLGRVCRYVFGSFCSEPWRLSNRYYGTGETFVFQLEPRQVGFETTRSGTCKLGHLKARPVSAYVSTPSPAVLHHSALCKRPACGIPLPCTRGGVSFYQTVVGMGFTPNRDGNSNKTKAAMAAAGGLVLVVA